MNNIFYVSWSVLLVYVMVALLSYISPGPDWAIISRHAFRSKTAGLWAALGVQSGLFVHMMIAVIGVVAIFSAFPSVFSAVQLAGALYLLYLGISILRQLRQHTGLAESEMALSSRHGTFGQGFIANVLNPKAALFFAGILPQFVDHTQPVKTQVLVLGVVDIVVGFLWWVVFVLAIHRIRQTVKIGRAQWVMDCVTGVFLLLFGLAMGAKVLYSTIHAA